MYGGIIFAKLSLPKKLRYIQRYSDVAVRNSTQVTFRGEGYPTGVESLTFRIGVGYSNTHVLNSSFHLVYFRTKTDENRQEIFYFQECGFEINKQSGRNRHMASLPLPGLPWTVTHPIDKNSPLFGVTSHQMDVENGEFVGILSGVDEVSSLSYQTR